VRNGRGTDPQTVHVPDALLQENTPPQRYATNSRPQGWMRTGPSVIAGGKQNYFLKYESHSSGSAACCLVTILSELRDIKIRFSVTPMHSTQLRSHTQIVRGPNEYV